MILDANENIHDKAFLFLFAVQMYEYFFYSQQPQVWMSVIDCSGPAQHHTGMMLADGGCQKQI